MNTKTLLPITLLCLAFSISSSQAHPNHMSFENIQHETRTDQSTTPINNDKILYDTQEQQRKHNDVLPCKEQHYKAEPCKNKNSGQ